MERLIINETTNTLLKCRYHIYEERLDCLIIPHSYDGKQIDAIRPHCFNRLIIGLPCIENGVKYPSDGTFENACVLNVKFPRSLKLAENALQTADCGKFFCPDICIPLRTRHDFGYQLKQLGKGLFDGCASLLCLKLEGSFDKLEPETFAGANEPYSLELQISADSLYIPSGRFCDTNLGKISPLGNFKPIMKK